MNSVIVPVFGDDSCPDVDKICERLTQHGLEVIFVSGCDSPLICKVVSGFGYRYIELSEQSRGARLQAGFLASSGNIVLFHHPRSLIDLEGIKYFSKMSGQRVWGGFTHKFDKSHPFLKWTSWYSNYARGRRGILYLDHCIFVSRDLLELIGGFPCLEIFEDTELSTRLRKHASPKLLPYIATTSAIRFEKNGFLKQGLLNQLVKIGFYFNISKNRMNRLYEKDMTLNSDYNRKVDQ